MSLTLVLALQTAVATPAPAAPPPARPPFAMLDFDLARYRPADGDGRCAGAGAGEVLVCGLRRRGGGAYPIDYWGRIFGPPAPIRAEMNLGGNVQGRIHAEAVTMDRGAVSNRVMVGIRMPF